MSRKSDRKHIFIIVFGIEFHKEFNPQDQISLYLTELALGRMERISGAAQLAHDDLFEGCWEEVNHAFIEEEVMGVIEHLDGVDKRISDAAAGWQLSRLSKVELAVMRIAVYELLYAKDIPTKVSINEAVEIGKLYSMETSPNFINGILAKIAAEIGEEQA